MAPNGVPSRIEGREYFSGRKKNKTTPQPATKNISAHTAIHNVLYRVHWIPLAGKHHDIPFWRRLWINARGPGSPLLINIPVIINPLRPPADRARDVTVLIVLVVTV